MRRSNGGLVAALALAAMTQGSPAASQDTRSTTLAELAGLSPVEVRARLVTGSESWPLQPAFEMATPAGRLSLYEAHVLVQHPETAGIAFSRRTHGKTLFGWDPHLCRITGDGASIDRAALVFRDGRFEGAYAAASPYPLPAGRPPPAPGAKPADRVAWYAEMAQRPAAPSPFLARFGALPLTDGDSFLQRWRREPIAAGVRITAACNLPPPAALSAVPRPATAYKPDLDQYALAPLILIYGPLTPLMNGARGEALKRGLTQLSVLKVGEPLGEAPERYAQRNKGVRVFREGDPDYAVMTLDLGGAPSNNTSDFRDAALVGIRGGRVEWISPPADFGVGPQARILCLDAENRPAEPRKGCHSGQFDPS